MEDDNPLEFFGDDLIDPSPVKEKSKKPAEPPSLEVWICRQTRKTLVDWISKNKQEKIQKFIAYDWSNPSERVRQHYRNLVREAPLENSPISALCTNGDPSGGKLLNILITILENGDIGDKNRQFFVSLAMNNKKVTPEQLCFILTHQQIDPFDLIADSARMHYSDKYVISAAIRLNNMEYLKGMLSLCQAPRWDQCLAEACQTSNLSMVKYFIEERGMSVNKIICDQTPLQHALEPRNNNNKKYRVVDYLLSRGANVNAKDAYGNTVLLYACMFGCQDISKLINSETDLRASYNANGVHGATAFGLAANYQPNFLKNLFEFKSSVKFDPEFERKVIEEVLVYGSYPAIKLMWQQVKSRDIVECLLTERNYTIDGEKVLLKPIEKFFKDFPDPKNTSHTDRWERLSLESQLRALWRHALKNLSRDEIEMLLRTKTTSGQQLIHTIESLNLVPEEYRLSNHLWSTNIEYDLGAFVDLPREIVNVMLGHLTFNETCQVASVSKSWFKEITSKTLWMTHPQASPNSSNPFRSIQKFLVGSQIMSRSDDVFCQMIEIDGEGLLVMEEGFLTGLKLNGEPIIASWPQFNGSVFRCMVRSRRLSQECIESSVKQIEHLLNGGRIEFDTLIDTLLPFLNCLGSEIYEVSVRVRGDYRLFEFSSDSNMADINMEFPFYPLVYFTQPSDLLSAERIKFYEKQIESGVRPAALALRAYEELFIIDGHHKILAYKNLGLIEELVVVCVEVNNRDRRKISVEEEMKYVNHSKAVVDRYNKSKKSMSLGAEDDD